MTKAVFCGAALALFACLSGQPGHAESGVAATIPDRAFFLYRPGDKTMENVVRTDERYGHDALFFGPRGWDYWNWLQDPRPIQNPNLWPDTQSTYFLSRFALPAGSTLTLHGTYPHARYFEFALYKFEHGTFVAVGEALRGQDIAPDPGATNPFLVGADRLAGVRDFTLRIVAADAPAGARATNTLYVGQDGGELQAALRIYLSDPGYDGAGWGPATAPFAGRGLPSYEGRLADGTRLSAAEVAARWAQPMAATKPAMTVVEWEGLLHAKNNDPALDPASAPARNPPEWQKFWTLRYSLLGAFKPPALRARIPYEGAMEGGGDPYTQYMIVYLSRKFGPVYVMHGKMPSFPDTFAGEDGKPLAIMPDAQVQYWSIVSCESPPSGQDVDGLTDMQVPLNSKGDYTIVVSRPEDRPRNATLANGVAWLNWGTRGEGLDIPQNRTGWGMLMIRFVGTNPSWAQSPANVTTPGTEASVMGPYYPRGEYTTKAAFEASGPK